MKKGMESGGEERLSRSSKGKKQAESAR